MEIFLRFLHVIAAIFMVIVVLLQQGKGADIGSAFGAGASQTVFGSRGAGNFLTKLTTGFVVLFMATSIALTYFSTSRSILSGMEPADPAPATAPSTAQPIPGSDSGPGNSSTPSGFEVVPAATPPADGSKASQAPSGSAPSSSGPSSSGPSSSRPVGPAPSGAVPAPPAESRSGSQSAPAPQSRPTN